MEKNYFIDFDGVILDSQDHFQNDMKDNINLNDWMEYLNSINWNTFIRECREIDESLTVLEKLQQLNKLKAIITTIHSFDEGREKTLFIRENKILVPVLYVLPGQKKCDIYLPNINDYLIDDKEKNCEDWILAGGNALLFDTHSEKTNKKKIKTLKQLL